MARPSSNKPKTTASTTKPADASRLGSLIRNRLLPLPQALPQSIDDAEQTYGLAIYDDMLDTSTELDMAYRYLRDRVFETGLSVLPACDAPLPGDEDPEAASDFATALEIAAFIQSNFEHLDARLASPAATLQQMFSVVQYGRSLAEITNDYVAMGPWKGKVWMTAFRHIPRENYAVISDPYGQILGVIGIIPGKASPLVNGIIPDPNAWSNFVPRERLLMLIVNPSTKHPAGKSLFRSSYRSWRAMRQVEPIELASLAQFGGEGMVLVGGENAFTVRTIKDAAGASASMTEMEYVTKMMQSWEPGTAVTLPNGWTKLDVGGTGNAPGFKTYFDRHARKIVGALIYSVSTLFEAERNSQAKSETSQDVSDVAVAALRKKIEDDVRQQVIRPLVVMNWGEDVASRFTPHLSLASIPTPDRMPLLSAMASALTAGVITQAMLPALWRKWLGEDFIPGEDDEKPESKKKDDDENKDSRRSGD